MTAPDSSLRQTRIFEITGNCLFLFLLGVGLFDQFMRFELGGVDLLLVCILIINYVNLFRSQLRQTSARIEELEKKLSTQIGSPDVRSI
ncbi:MAG: hypothetical protein WA268_08580 [Xanthobacteraceae bacterium]|jgi:hypothetical protein